MLWLSTAVGTRGSGGTRSTPLPRHPPAPRRGRALMALPGCGRSLLAHKTPHRALRLCLRRITGPCRSPASLLKPERGRQSEVGPLRAGFGCARQGSGVPFPVPIYFHSLCSRPGCQLWCGGVLGAWLGARRRRGRHAPPFPESILGGGMQPRAFAEVISMPGFHSHGVNAELHGSSLTSVLFAQVNPSGSWRCGMIQPGRGAKSLL